MRTLTPADILDGAKPMTLTEHPISTSNPLFLANLEKAANRYETWIEERAPGHIAAMRQMMKEVATQARKAA
jgi:hypothetical protein